MAKANYTSKMLAGNVHALVAGEGTPVICIAGWPQTAECFLDVLPALSKHYRVLALDPPGLGASAPSSTGYDTYSISTLLIAAIKSELGSTARYHLVGHDVGAWIAFSWAAMEQPSLFSVTLMEASFFGFTPSLTYPLPHEGNIKLWQFAFNRLPDLPEVLTSGRERELLNWLFDNKAVHPELITKARRDRYVEAYSRPGGMSDGFAYYRDVMKSSDLNQARYGENKLNIPVMVVGGDHAAGVFMKSIPEKITNLGSQSRSVILEDCGHYLMEEQPEACAKTLLDFIKSVEIP